MTLYVLWAVLIIHFSRFSSYHLQQAGGGIVLDKQACAIRAYIVAEEEDKEKRIKACKCKTYRKLTDHAGLA